jgi:hypothetical protein
VSALESEDVSRVLDDRHLEAETEAQERNVVLSTVLDGFQFPLDAAGAEAAGDDDAVGLFQPILVAIEHLVGVDPQDVYLSPALDARVLQRLADGHIGVFEVVLADQRDVDLIGPLARDQFPPAVLTFRRR